MYIYTHYIWVRLLRVPWTARWSNQSILKEISPGISLEGMMLKLKLQYFLPPHAKSWLIGKDWCWEGLGVGGEGGDRGWDGWMASLTRWMWVWVNSGSWWWTGRPGVLRFVGSQRVGHDWASDLIGPYGLLILTQPREHFSRILRWKLGHVLWLSSSIFKNLFSRNTCLDILRLYVHLALFIIMKNWI